MFFFVKYILKVDIIFQYLRNDFFHLSDLISIIVHLLFSNNEVFNNMSLHLCTLLKFFKTLFFCVHKKLIYAKKALLFLGRLFICPQ